MRRTVGVLHLDIDVLRVACAGHGIHDAVARFMGAVNRREIVGDAVNGARAVGQLYGFRLLATLRAVLQRVAV